MLFAALELDREPLQWSQFPAAVASWVQTVGTVSAIGLGIWLLAYYLQGPGLVWFQRKGMFKSQTPRSMGLAWTGEALAVAVLAGIAGIAYLLAIIFALGNLIFEPSVPTLPGREPVSPSVFSLLSVIFLTVGGAAAFFAVAVPPLRALPSLSCRRIWALTRLSLKEAIRSKIVVIFALMAVLLLFIDWFVPYKPEDQLRNYVRAIYGSLGLVFVLTASLLGAFSISSDLRSQALFTIVTKPVERFEIVAGRFLGYGLLLTAGLAVLGGLGLLYLARGVGEKAKEESYRARVPLYGELSFRGTYSATRGISVGRVWDYRSYIGVRSEEITHKHKPRQYALWSFSTLPDPAGQDAVLVQITFDIHREYKAEEGKSGVPCSFLFGDGRWNVPEAESKAAAYRQEEAELDAQLGKKGILAGKKKALIKEELIPKHGVYVLAGFRVADYHTQTLEVPALLLHTLREQGARDFQVLVSVDEDPDRKRSQKVGMARRDLYVLQAEEWFEVNFLKGFVGLWCMTLLVLGLAIAVNTYLSGVISWLCAMFLIIAGIFIDFIRMVAFSPPSGDPLFTPGPVEAAIRVAQNKPGAVELEGPIFGLVKGLDEGSKWLLRRFLDILPEVKRFNLDEYVASGFGIPWSHVLLLDNLIPLVAYLTPWAILAYYLMRYQEVANPN